MSTYRPIFRLSTAARAVRVSSRRLTTVADGSSSNYLAEKQAVREHAKHTTELWRKICFYVCVPGTLVCLAWVRNVEGEHSAHIEHIKEENGGELPETPQYDYLNKRVKPFPWGNNSLFFNPHSNKDMEESSE